MVDDAEVTHGEKYGARDWLKVSMTDKVLNAYKLVSFGSITH